MKTYYIKQKISLDDKYYVSDANNKPYLEIESKNKLLTLLDRFFGRIFTLGNKIYLKHLDGKEIITIKKKCGLFKQEYDLYDADKKIASVKLPLASLKPKISITTQTDNYTVKGDLMALNFIILKNKICIAQIKKTIFDLTDTYKIDISYDTEEFMCIALLIIIDNSLYN